MATEPSWTRDILSSVSSGFRRQVLEMSKVGSFKYLSVHITLLSVI
jgi:hypothetical protein